MWRRRTWPSSLPDRRAGNMTSARPRAAVEADIVARRAMAAHGSPAGHGEDRRGLTSRPTPRYFCVCSPPPARQGGLVWPSGRRMGWAWARGRRTLLVMASRRGSCCMSSAAVAAGVPSRPELHHQRPVAVHDPPAV